MTTDDAPAPRAGFVAVWTGNSLIIWGGVTDEQSFTDGAIYDPAADRWTPFDCPLNILGRRDAAGVWTGSELVVWGGINGSHVLGDGFAFEPRTGHWRKLNDENAPSPRAGHMAVFTGNAILLWGSRSGLLGGKLFNTGATYDPQTDCWSPLSTEQSPLGRQNGDARFNGRFLVVTGGYDLDGQHLTGSIRYDVERGVWSSTEP